MPKSFQWITLLLIESIYFASIRVKGPHTLVWIIPSKSTGPLGCMSKIQIHWTSGKHVQISNPLDLSDACSNSNPLDLCEACPKFNPLDLWEARPNSNPSDLWDARPNFKPSDLWEAHPKFKSIGPLRSTSKILIYKTSGKHVQNSRSWLKSSFCRDHW